MPCTFTFPNSDAGMVTFLFTRNKRTIDGYRLLQILGDIRCMRNALRASWFRGRLKMSLED